MNNVISSSRVHYRPLSCRVCNYVCIHEIQAIFREALKSFSFIRHWEKINRKNAVFIYLIWDTFTPSLYSKTWKSTKSISSNKVCWKLISPFFSNINRKKYSFFIYLIWDAFTQPPSLYKMQSEPEQIQNRLHLIVGWLNFFFKIDRKLTDKNYVIIYLIRYTFTKSIYNTVQFEKVQNLLYDKFFGLGKLSFFKNIMFLFTWYETRLPHPFIQCSLHLKNYKMDCI